MLRNTMRLHVSILTVYTSLQLNSVENSYENLPIWIIVIQEQLISIEAILYYYLQFSKDGKMLAVLK